MENRTQKHARLFQCGKDEKQIFHRRLHTYTNKQPASHPATHHHDISIFMSIP